MKSIIPQRLLSEGLLKSEEINPHKPVIIINNTEYSYNFFKNCSLKLASHLIKIGLKKGDKVAIFMNNTLECAISIYGVSFSGGVFLIINPQTKPDKLHFILNDCSANIIITESNLIEVVTSSLNLGTSIKNIIISEEINISTKTNLTAESFQQIITKGKISDNFHKVIPNDLAALIYTSGSTGYPKGVMMTHQSMVFTSWSLIEYLRLSDSDRIMLVLPLAFDYGLYQLIMTVTLGCTLIMDLSTTFQTIIYKQLKQYNPTVLPGIPTIYAMMIQTFKKSGLSFSCIQKVTNTAAALPEEYIPYLKKIFPNALIFKMYGLTECKRVCYLEPELLDQKPNSVGKPIPGTEVFLLTPEGNPVTVGEPGILHVRGPHVMAGYWNREDLSKEMLKPGTIPGERILCTQDLFKMDEDGFLYFLGRRDDIIKTRGEKVSPVEIENVIYKMPNIKEVAVIGIEDSVMGESIIAFITTHNNITFDEKNVRRECLSKLESFMVPQKIIFLESMPKSANGKIDKHKLKLMVQN